MQAARQLEEQKALIWRESRCSSVGWPQSLSQIIYNQSSMSYLFNIQDRSYMLRWCWMSIGKTFCSERESNEENAGKSCEKYEK